MLTPAIAAGMLMMGVQAGPEGPMAPASPVPTASPAIAAPASGASMDPQAAPDGASPVLVVPPPPVMPNLPGSTAPAAAAPQPGEIVVTGHTLRVCGQSLLGA